jgi:LDH2 family malate/lactate/ureidoglycolate dehydrogenase
MGIEPTILEHFARDVLCTAGVDSAEATIVAKVLVWTELIGRSTLGLIRLSAFIERYRRGLIESPCRPKWVQKADVVDLREGHYGFGREVGHLAMLKALEVATRWGVGVVGVHQSNHLLAGAYYVELAAQQGQLGWATSNAFPRVAPYGGVTAALGTNPFAFAAPLRDGQSILVDFSTGALAGGTIRQALAEQRDLPPGLVVAEDGRDILDPVQANQETILPFGGAKGFTLGLMIEILSGVITGAAISHEIASFYNDFTRPANLGHFFLALDIAKFMPMEPYYERMETLLAFIKTAKLREGFAEILIPGEMRWRTYQRQLVEGLQLSTQTRQSLINLAEEWQVSVPF